MKYLIAIFAIFGSITVAYAGAPKPPDGTAPLTEVEIKQLLNGNTYEFVAYDEPLTGTTMWDYDKGTVSGSYVWDKKQKGKFAMKWYLKDGRSCTQSEGKKAVCQVIYPYETGFIEITPDGVVHAVSTPMK